MNKIVSTLLFCLIALNCCAEIESGCFKSDSSSVGYNDRVYQLFPTQNMWTFIKLNTRNGLMWQVQYDVKGNNRFETELNSISLVNEADEVNGRFMLYSTQNMYNFMLLDQIEGSVWQVQWSHDPEDRMIIPIRNI